MFPHPSQNEIPYLFPTFSRLDGPHSLPILHEIVWNRFTYGEYFKNIWYERTCFFLTIWFCLWSNIPLLIFELSYIFHIFRNMKFPTFSWLFHPFPNPSWLCQPIPYLFKALKKLNLIPDFFKIFPTSVKPDYWYTCLLGMYSACHIITITSTQVFDSELRTQLSMNSDCGIIIFTGTQVFDLKLRTQLGMNSA